MSHPVPQPDLPHLGNNLAAGFELSFRTLSAVRIRLSATEFDVHAELSALPVGRYCALALALV